MKKLNLIRNCEVQFRVQCPRLWDSLQPTDDSAIRFCGQCQHNVFLCATDTEAIAHAHQGHCIAKPIADTTGIEKFRIGMVTPPPPQHTPEETAALHDAGLEKAKTRALRDSQISSRNCPQCGFPAANWVSHCYVCHFELGKIKPKRDPAPDAPDA